MVDLTSEQRELTGSVVAKVNEVDWNGDITPWIESIVSVVGGLVAQDPRFVEFAGAIKDQATQWSLAAWSENLVDNIGDSGWSRLSHQLAQFVTSSD
ncbi:hypothetical protein [Microbacterium lacticum]